MGITRSGEVENLGRMIYLRERATSLATAAPALEDASSSQYLLEPSICVNGRFLARYVGDSQVADLSSRPLRPTIDLPIEKNAGADTFTDSDENEIVLLLCRPAVVFALRRKVGIVFDNNRALQLVLEHMAQRHGSPIL